jgi:hypothetical protein
MAPRSAPKRAKAETSDVAEVGVQTVDTTPPPPPPSPSIPAPSPPHHPPAQERESGAEIIKALAKLQRSLNKTQRAVQLLQTQGGDQTARPPKPKREPSGFARPSRISTELSSFLGVSPNTRLARTQVTKLLTE